MGFLQGQMLQQDVENDMMGIVLGESDASRRSHLVAGQLRTAQPCRGDGLAKKRNFADGPQLDPAFEQAFKRRTLAPPTPPRVQTANSRLSTTLADGAELKYQAHSRYAP